MSKIEVSKDKFFDECRKSGFYSYEGTKDLNSPDDVINVLDENKDVAISCSGLPGSSITVEGITPDGRELIDRVVS